MCPTMLARESNFLTPNSKLVCLRSSIEFNDDKDSRESHQPQVLFFAEFRWWINKHRLTRFIFLLSYRLYFNNDSHFLVVST